MLRISHPVDCNRNIDNDINDITQANESNKLGIIYDELSQPVTVDEVKNSIKQLKSGIIEHILHTWTRTTRCAVMRCI